jgi:hypothetical protein
MLLLRSGQTRGEMSQKGVECQLPARPLSMPSVIESPYQSLAWP